MTLHFKCPECGSEVVVWDRVKGDIVCTFCGLVIGKIYDYNAHVKEDDYNYKVERDIIGIRRIKARLNVYEKYMRKFNLKPYLKIKEDVLNAIMRCENVKMVKTIVRRETINFKPTKEHELVLEIISKYPTLASRTDVVKHALVEVLISTVKTSKPNIYSIARKFKVDPSNLRKAYRKALSYKGILEEVKAKLTLKHLVEV